MFYGLDFQAMQVLNLVEVGTPDGEELGMTTEEYSMEDEL